MTDEVQHRNVRIRRRPRPPLVVMNPPNDVDDDDDEDSDFSNPPSTHTQHISSPIACSSSSDRIPSLNQVAFNLPRAKTPVFDLSVGPNALSNPTLSSPSASDSPIVESASSSTQESFNNTYMTEGDEETTGKSDRTFCADRQDLQVGSSKSLTVVGKLRQHVTNALHVRRPSNHLQQSSTQSLPNTAAYESTGKAHRDSLSIMVTADCDSYASLDISGVREATVLREMIFSRLQISDELQAHFALYRTEIGSFALGEALSEDQLLRICLEEGDSKGSLKFLAQHASAPLHLPPSRDAVKNLVPPVLPNQLAFDHSHRSVSSPSYHGSKSSTSDPIVPEGLSTGYEGSASDDIDRFIRSPLHSRSPGGGLNPHTLSSPSMSVDKNRSHAANSVLSPKSSNSDDARGISSSFNTNRDHPSSEAAVDKDRSLDFTVKANLRSKGISRTQEPWVVVPNVTRSAVTPQSPSAGRLKNVPHTADVNGKYPSHPYSYSNQVPSLRRHATPSSTTQRPAGRQVPHNWLPKFGNLDVKHPQSPRSSGSSLRSYPKSMDNLKNDYNSSYLTSGASPHKLASSKPSMLTLSDANSHHTGLQNRVEHTSNLHVNSSHPTAIIPRSFDGSRVTAASPGLYGRSRDPISSSPVLPFGDNMSNQLKSSSLSSSPGVPPTSNTWQGQDSFMRSASVADDIGASPHPSRQVRLLPSIGQKKDFMDGAQGRDHIVQYSPAEQQTRTLTDASHLYLDERHNQSRITDADDRDYSLESQAESQANQREPDFSLRANSPKDVTSPASPRGAHLEQRSAKDRKSPAQQNFISMDDSNYGTDTLRSDKHAWIVEMLEGKHNESTVMPKSNHSGILSGFGKSTSSPDAEDVDEDDDYDSEGGTSTLWKTPPSKTPQIPGRPQLTVETGNGKTISQSGSRTIPRIPDYVPQTRRSRKGKDNTPKRYSSFAKNSAVSWSFRPPAEDVVDQLEEYFPDHDLDKPMIEATSGGSSPTAVEPNIATLTAMSANDKRSRHKKSIRLVAAEHKKKIDHSSRSDSSSVASILRKRSTKLWGSKVEELTPSHAKYSIPSAVPESPNGPSNPKPIFKWIRGELIGKGTYGRVYLALNATTGEMIAVKQVEIPKTDSDRDDSRQITVVEALKLESETLKDLDHPNIVQYLGFEQTPDFLSIFLEYVPGGSVASCLRRHGKFDDECTRSFTGQILSGLEYLHSNGIIHRDLKADNILVDPSGVCKISDFGISKRTDDINANGAFTGMTGSVFWMAPEVVNPGRKGAELGYNGKVDIWSLGCVVLEMWAGRRPWQDADAIAVIYELVTNQKPPPVPSDVVLSAEADDFRKKCFAIRPSERPAASELRDHPYLELSPGWAFSGFK